jgi:hypothetical protein
MYEELSNGKVGSEIDGGALGYIRQESIAGIAGIEESGWRWRKGGIVV